MEYFSLRIFSNFQFAAKGLKAKGISLRNETHAHFRLFDHQLNSSG